MRSLDVLSEPFVLAGIWNFGISTTYPQAKSLIYKAKQAVPKKIPVKSKLDIRAVFQNFLSPRVGTKWNRTSPKFFYFYLCSNIPTRFQLSWNSLGTWNHFLEPNIGCFRYTN